MSRLRGIRRNLAFARHIPPSRIVRRIALDLKRRWLQKPAGRPLPDAGPWLLAAIPPRPIFPARTGKLAATPKSYAFTFLNRTETLPRPLDWRAFTGSRRDQLWSMNLHYMEFLEAADDATFEALIIDWLAAVRPYGTGYWRDAWNSYAVSLRVVVWMQQLAVRTALPQALRDAMNNSLAGQIEFLARNLETDLAGNHLIKNIKALIWASAYFSGDAAQRWRQLGLRHLQRALAEQILPDGMHFERSPSYHAQVFADLLECRAALGGEALLNVVLNDVLKRMAQVTADLTHPDGGPALFNDAGLTMCYAPGICLAAFESAFGYSQSRQTVFAYREAGFFGSCRNGDVVIADCGPIGADSLPAHAHGDVLAFELSVAGRRIIVDQGVYEYVAGPKRTASRATASHNTLGIRALGIKDCDQADFFGDFRVGRRPRVQVRRWEPRPDGFLLEGTHDGFTRTPGAPRHVRRFNVERDRIVIGDTIEGENRTGATAGILLHPDVQIARRGDAIILSSGGVEIALTATRALSIEAAVWWPDMGVEIATRRITADLPAEVQTVGQKVSQTVAQTLQWTFAIVRRPT